MTVLKSENVVSFRNGHEGLLFLILPGWLFCTNCNRWLPRGEGDHVPA